MNGDNKIVGYRYATNSLPLLITNALCVGTSAVEDPSSTFIARVKLYSDLTVLIKTVF